MQRIILLYNRIVSVRKRVEVLVNVLRLGKTAIKEIYADFQENNIVWYNIIWTFRGCTQVRETPLSHCTRRTLRHIDPREVRYFRPRSTAVGAQRRLCKGTAARDDIRPPAIRRVALKRSTKKRAWRMWYIIIIAPAATPPLQRSRKGSRPRVPRDYRNGVAAAAEIKLR